MMSLAKTQPDDKAPPTVSVLMATYNRAEMLRRAVQSVLNQTFEDFELIIVSDASTDNTAEVVRSFDDPRIIFLEQERNQGYPSARNRGLEACRGKYIAFLDDDDEWLPDKLESQVSFFKESLSEVGLIYGWSEVLQEKESSFIHSPEIRGDARVELMDKQPLGFPSTTMIKREVLETIGFLDAEYSRGADTNYWCRISKRYTVDFVPKVVARIHVGHPVRITVDSTANLRDIAVALERRLDILREEFETHQSEKASLYGNAMTAMLKLRQFGGAFRYARNILSCKTGAIHKSQVFYVTAKRFVAHELRRLRNGN